MWIKNQQINKPKETTSIRGRDTCRTRRHQSPKQPRSQGPRETELLLSRGRNREDPGNEVES